jgi:catechol 2,3-dioxygenase-like lactoylglutathione lyase family enzyme
VFTAGVRISEAAILNITQLVSDQERSLAFYRDVLGFEVRRDVTVGAGSRWIEVAPPGSSVTIALVAEGSGVPLGVSVGVPHIDLTHESMQREQVDVDDAVIRTTSAPPMFSVRDPDGNTVIIIEAPASP